MQPFGIGGAHAAHCGKDAHAGVARMAMARQRWPQAGCRWPERAGAGLGSAAPGMQVFAMACIGCQWMHRERCLAKHGQSAARSCRCAIDAQSLAQSQARAVNRNALRMVTQRLQSLSAQPAQETASARLMRSSAAQTSAMRPLSTMRARSPTSRRRMRTLSSMATLK